MMKTEEQKSNIKSLIGTIESVDRLARFRYLEQENGCMCAIGHVAKSVGELYLLVKKDNSKKIIDHPAINILSPKVMDKYGLDKSELSSLQDINDEAYDSERKEIVVQFLTEIMDDSYYEDEEMS